MDNRGRHNKRKGILGFKQTSTASRENLIAWERLRAEEKEAWGWNFAKFCEAQNES